MIHYRFLPAAALVVAVRCAATADLYDPPEGFYDGATGTGSVLDTQLYDIMRSGHIQRRYGDFRYSAILHDQDPNNPNNILLGYSRVSVSGTWDSGQTWNREHVWPQSLQPGSASNGTRGNLGDPHALRPLNPSINSSRGNKPFGLGSTTGSFRSLGTYYFPGDADKGDVARSLFYSDVRWGTENGIRLDNGTPGSNEMGDLASLIEWHYLDAPDDFERRRNHVIYSQAENPSYYTNNRNAFVDRPEYVWSVFVDQQNDSQISLGGGTTNGSGQSTLAVDLGRVLVGGPSAGTTQVTVNKAGQDGTYYSVATGGAATSSVTGRHHAFRTNGTDSATLTVGLNASADTPGQTTGTVTINNLDVTTAGGTGRGANDADDTINLTYTVLAHANGSFSNTSDQNHLSLDFGTFYEGTSPAALGFDLFNFADGQAFTAGLDLNSVVASGDSAAFTSTLSAFSNLAAGQSLAFETRLVTDSVGSFSSTYTLFTSDEDLPGAAQGDAMSLTLTGTVAEVVAGDMNLDGTQNAADLAYYVLAIEDQASYTSTVGINPLLPGDLDGDGDLDQDDARLAANTFATVVDDDLVNRTQNFIDLDLALDVLDDGAVNGTDNNFFATLLATPKDYEPGDARGDLAGTGVDGAIEGADGVIDATDIDFLFQVLAALEADDLELAELQLASLAVDANGDDVFDATDGLLALDQLSLDQPAVFDAEAWYQSLTLTSVPEPAVAGWLLVSAWVLRRRRVHH